VNFRGSEDRRARRFGIAAAGSARLFERRGGVDCHFWMTTLCPTQALVNSK
jgi:hypothetical protein